MALGRLRQWAGLSYRQLAAKAEASGDVLPPSTAVGALSRAALPREELVAAFVRACGMGEADVARWVVVRRHLAVSAVPRSPLAVEEAGDAPAPTGPQRTGIPHPPGPVSPDPPSPGSASPDSAFPDSASPGSVSPGPASSDRDAAGPPFSGSDPSKFRADLNSRDLASAGSDSRVPEFTGSNSHDPDPVPDPAGPDPVRPDPVVPAGRSGRRRPTVAVVVAGVAAVLVVIGVTVAALEGALATGPPAVRTPDPVSAGSVLADGRYRMVPSHVADRDLCVGEGRERNGRTTRELAVQRPCRGLSPDTYLTAVGRDVYQIEWHHPVHGVGCLTVDQAADGTEALIGPANCTGAAHQRFLLERAGPRASGGFVLRPTHSGLCVGALYGVADVDVGAELAQQACTGQADQVFLFLSAPEPGG